MKERAYKISDLLSLTVLTVFVLCALLVLLLGGRVYRNLAEAGEETDMEQLDQVLEETYRSRTACQYLTTRVQQAGEVSISDFGGSDALVIREEVGSRVYVTRIYCYDGWLRELYCAENADLQPVDGEKVLEAESLSLSLEDGLLHAKIDGSGLILQLRSGREVLP